MQFMLVARETPEAFEQRRAEDKAAFEAYIAPWYKFSQEMSASGVTLYGNALQGPETATCVKVRNGKTEVQDGPFADTKEQLGGFFVIDVENIAVAQEWAAQCPAAIHGAVDVRPVMAMDGGE